MKKITFPEPDDEQAIAIMENARKELETLGYEACYKSKINGDALGQEQLNVYIEINLCASKNI